MQRVGRLREFLWAGIRRRLSNKWRQSKKLRIYRKGLQLQIRALRLDLPWRDIAYKLNKRRFYCTGYGRGKPWTESHIQKWYSPYTLGVSAKRRKALLAEVFRLYLISGSYRQTAKALHKAGWRSLSGLPITERHVWDYVRTPCYGLAQRIGPLMHHDKAKRPQIRGHCVDGPRPCPWVSCRYHLALYQWARGDAHPGDRGSYGVKYSRPEVKAGELDGVGYRSDSGAWVATTCALDVADEGPINLARIAEIHGVSREWERKVYRAAEAKIKAGAPEVWMQISLLYEESKGRGY